ncbi:MAG: TraR/DksA family transcriptional regulator [Saprospiraceae bacterium]
MMITQIGNRYSETELAEFKALIDKKIEKTERQLTSLEEQLAYAAESKYNEGDWMDDSSNNTDIEMLEVMANRQRKHLLDLQNALQRIYNKSYGICIISGELIDKRRLMAVPTTTKSLAAKMDNGRMAIKKTYKPEARPKASTPKIISKIIRKSVTKPVVAKDWDTEDDLDLEMDNEFGLATEVDFDSYSGEDLD